MAQKNTTAYILLGLLAHEDASGYDLKKRIDHMISMFWDVGYGQLYPTLKQLEKRGLVSGHGQRSGKGPDRVVYSLTDEGRRELAGWLVLPEQREYVRYEILLKLFFGSLNGPAENLRRIERFRRRHGEDLRMIGLFKGNLERALFESRDHFYYYLTVLFGEHIYKAYLDWADEASRLIRENRSFLADGKGANHETSENP